LEQKHPHQIMLEYFTLLLRSKTRYHFHNNLLWSKSRTTK